MPILWAEPTNEDRAGWAAEAVHTFKMRVGQEDEDLKTNITDLLCDLMHLAARDGVDFDQASSHALDHYLEELSEAGDEII